MVPPKCSLSTRAQNEVLHSKWTLEGLFFSCLFHSGAEISCMNMDTVAALGLLGKLTQSSVTVNTASRQNMSVAGDVQVNFKNR